MERGTRNAEHGTRNAEHGTQNAERRTLQPNNQLTNQLINQSTN